MNWSEARDVLLSHFMTNFTYPEIVIGYDNTDLTPDMGKPWLKLTIRPVTGRQSSLGPEKDRKFRRAGIIGCAFAVPANTWTANADEIATELIDLFESKSIGGVNISSGNYSNLGVDGSWFRCEVVFDFYFIEIK